MPPFPPRRMLHRQKYGDMLPTSLRLADDEAIFEHTFGLRFLAFRAAMPAYLSAESNRCPQGRYDGLPRSRLRFLSGFADSNACAN